jgi:hypothetical protein
VPPERPKTSAVPPDHGLGLDDGQGAAPAWPQPSQENPDQSVLIVQARTLPRAIENLELMTESDDLEDKGLPGSKSSSDQV